MSTQTATQPGAVKITLHSANNDVDEQAEVTVALKHPEEAVAKMLRTLAQRFPPESVMTIQPTGFGNSRQDYFASSAVASGDNLLHEATNSAAIHKNRDDSPLTQASSANGGSRRNTPSRSKDSGPRLSTMGYNYPPNPVYSTSQDGSQRKGTSGQQRSNRQQQTGIVDDGPLTAGSPSNMEGVGMPMFPGMPFSPFAHGPVMPGVSGMTGMPGVAGMAGMPGMTGMPGMAGVPMFGPGGMPNGAEAYTQGAQFGQMGGWPMMPPPHMFPYGYPMMIPPGSPMVDANGKVISGSWPYPPPPPVPPYAASPAAAAGQTAAGFAPEMMHGTSTQYVVGPDHPASATESRQRRETDADLHQQTAGAAAAAAAAMQNAQTSQMLPTYTTSPGSQISQNRPFETSQRPGGVSGAQNTTDILGSLQPGFGEYCHVGPDGLRTRYVEVEVVEEREIEVPKVEVREVTREEKEIKYETVVREVEEVEYVDEVVEQERVIEQEREVRVPIKKVKEVPVERVTHKTVDIVNERVEVIEKPEIVEVEKFYTVEQPQPVPRYNQKDVPCMVAQKLRPSVRSEGKMTVPTTTYEPVLYAVEVYIPKPVANAIIPRGKIDETHQRVDIPAAQYNSLVHKLNTTLDKQVVNEVCLKTVEGHVPLLPAGELADIVPPLPGAWADDRGMLIRSRGGQYNSSGAFITKEKKHKKSHRKHRHHKN